MKSLNRPWRHLAILSSPCPFSVIISKFGASLATNYRGSLLRPWPTNQKKDNYPNGIVDVPKDFYPNTRAKTAM